MKRLNYDIKLKKLVAMDRDVLKLGLKERIVD
jgi:hypothetical protein